MINHIQCVCIYLKVVLLLRNFNTEKRVKKNSDKNLSNFWPSYKKIYLRKIKFSKNAIL